MATKWILLVVSLILTDCWCVNIESLNGIWTVRSDNGEYHDIPATVPGGIYSDLMNYEIIGDIFHGFNDVNTKWVPRLNWTYFRTFQVDDDLLRKENVNLVCDGLDTFADIYINNVLIGSSRNMFVRYIFNVKNALKTGDNYIEVRFKSPIEMGDALAQEQAKSYVVPPECPPNEYNGECHVNMIRKMQASYSWDWGPSFPSVGIWKNIYIESYTETTIRYVSVDVTDDGINWHANVDVYLANNGKNKVTGQLTINLQTDATPIDEYIDVDVSPNEYGELVKNFEIVVPKNIVSAWWPNGYGEQYLYDLTVTVTTNGQIEDTKTQHIGFRKIELIQDQLNYGTTFYFKVNDLPIFMKGTNEIPLDILPERGQDPTLIETLLGTARDAHMNMIRVWGGGVYESDYFYDVADRYGILIWQDFMFACAMYPTYDSYLENVLEEVRHQVNRLRSHPSIALFAGNNENEAALRQSWYGTSDNFDLYYNDFIKLYITTIQTEFNRITRNKRIFLSSSPTNGVESISEGYVAQNPGDYAYGDVHFYNYVADPWDSNVYPVSRFSSEYGYQALPGYQSLITAADQEGDLNMQSEFMYHRQHHPGGNEQMKELIEFNLNLPENYNVNYSKAFIYKLQIAQALGIKIETEHYRRYRSTLNDQGLGGTMGALYWQLNDVWLAPTWSGIDFTGKWKMLQYFVQEFFYPIIITGHIDSQRNLDVYVVLDSIYTIGEQNDLTASIQVFNWNSLQPIHTDEIAVDVNEGESALIKTIPTDQYLSDLNCGDVNNAKFNCFFSLSMRNSNGNIGYKNYVFPGTLKYSNLPRANVRIGSVTTTMEDPSQYSITVISDNIALFVWLETSVKGEFSQNGLVLTEGTTNIIFHSKEATSEESLRNTLTVIHLMDENYM
ncbi:beta-mannosidase-like [Diorhabda sublineata]|uniref:beta-mannosidase-like n=1 Tax=Diorhabda sublineata TaxID=1163346 RepID=UPI0024E0F1C1|nr:beta-mannosidase-like [Diorhabda sublineata]